MELTWRELNYLGVCLEGFFFGMVSSTVKHKLLLAKAVQHCAIPGLYSGIFAMHLQHRGSQKSADKAKNILFYVPWVLYTLSVATIILDTLTFCSVYAVSMDDHRCLKIFFFN